MSTSPRKRIRPVDYKPAIPPKKNKAVGGVWILIGLLLSGIGLWGYYAWDDARRAKVPKLSLTPLLPTSPTIASASVSSTPQSRDKTNHLGTLSETPRILKEKEVASLLPAITPEPPLKPIKQELISSPQPDTPPPTSFDFYKLLPELKVGDPSETSQPTQSMVKGASHSHETTHDNKKETTDHKNKGGKDTHQIANSDKEISTTKNYMLQAGAFHSAQEADRQRARLSYLGLEVHIQTVTTGSEMWHRVRLGPFRDMAQATQIQQRLRHEGINTTINQDR